MQPKKFELETGKLNIHTISSSLYFTIRGPINTFSSVNFGYTISGDVLGTDEDVAIAKARLDSLVTAFCRDRFPEAIEELKQIVYENEEQL